MLGFELCAKPASPALLSEAIRVCRNQWIHIACVWPILFTSIVLFSYIQLPDAVTSLIPAWAASSTFPVDVNNVGFVLGCCYLVWHFYLDISIGLVANVLVVACLLASTAIHRNKEIAGDAYMYAWAVHIFCWIAQFYGHGVHEQRRPALFENLFACESSIQANSG